MTNKEVQEFKEYMRNIFDTKEPVETTTGKRLLREDGYFNWLLFNLALFKYLDVNKFTDKQRSLIHEFQNQVKGSDCHDPYKDYYGDSLVGMSKTLNRITKK